jgi:pterin-4a-carbinolamine dehydratase
LAFNINPEGMAAVLPDTPVKKQKLTARRRRIGRTVRFHNFRESFDSAQRVGQGDEHDNFVMASTNRSI